MIWFINSLLYNSANHNICQFQKCILQNFVQNSETETAKKGTVPEKVKSHA